MEPFRPGMRADEIRILRLPPMAETYSRYQTDLFIGPFPAAFRSSVDPQRTFAL